MRLFAIAGLVLGFLPAHGHAEVFLRRAAIHNRLAFDRGHNTAGSYVIRQRSRWQVAQVTDKEPTAATSVAAGEAPSASNSLKAICTTLQSSASANDLPLTFLMRLIWQESRFDADAVSPAGARGIAQFMPGTAAWVGLKNPFEVSDAIRKSAAFLRSLENQFGNLGLAAAAYNAGPKRVQDWLADRGGLPAETRTYVRIVTGRSIDEWRFSRSNGLTPILAETIPCLRLAKHLVAQSSRSVIAGMRASAAVVSSHGPAWGVQLLGNNSKASVLAAYRQLQIRYKSVLGQRQPLVIPSKVGRTSYWYRVRVAADSLPAAQRLCSSLRNLGASCLVQRN